MGPDMETGEICHKGIEDGNLIKEFVSKEALTSMVPDIETKEICHTGIEGGNSIKETEDKLMGDACNNKDQTVEIKSSLDALNDGEHPRGNVEVNIMDCTNSCDDLLFEVGGHGASENSSSFGGTISGAENDATMDGEEVTSELHGDVPSSSYEGFDLFRMRKKRLTPHWSSYRYPIAWRLKWLELQINEVEFQAAKYDRLIKLDHEKLLELEKSDDFAAKSLPYSSQSPRDKVRRRKKRKRVEATTDAASYMSQHNLFSFYENRRHTADGAVDEEWLNPVISADREVAELEVNDELVFLEPQDGDSFWEHILWKIGVAVSRVSKLKTCIHNVMSENAEVFNSTDKLSSLVPYDLLRSSAPKPASPPNNGDRMLVGSPHIAPQLLLEYNMGDLIMPGSAVVNQGEVIHHPDANVNTDHTQVGASCSNTGHEILIYKRRAKVGSNNFEEVKVLHEDKFQSPKVGQDSTDLKIPVLEPDLSSDDQPIPKIRSISKLTVPRNKRKRGRQKAGRWNQRG